MCLWHKKAVYGVKTTMQSTNTTALLPDWSLTDRIPSVPLFWKFSVHVDDMHYSVPSCRWPWRGGQDARRTWWQRNSEINLTNLGHESPEKLGLKITLDWGIWPPAETNNDRLQTATYLLKLVIEQNVHVINDSAKQVESFMNVGSNLLCSCRRYVLILLECFFCGRNAENTSAVGKIF